MGAAQRGTLDIDVRPWRWRPAVSRTAAGLAFAGFSTMGGVVARSGFDDSTAAWLLLTVGVVMAVAGSLIARSGGRHRGLALPLVPTAGVLGALGAWTAGDAYGWSWEARLAGLAVVATPALVQLGLFSPLGRSAWIGAGAVAATVTVWELAALLADDPARIGVLPAVVSVVTLGLLPRLALMGAGLTGLDDRRSAGVSVSRHHVDTALAGTHRGLALATVVTAASAASAGWLMVDAHRGADAWTVALTVVLAVVLLSRSRAYPLVAEVVALLTAAAVLLVRLAVLWAHGVDGPPYGPLAVLGVAALLPLAVLAVELPEHVRIRLRRVADLVESAGVIALFPLAVGAFGVYGRLLNAF
ncbi:type VII secretion integral membrane protein EccD [Streptomyces sp. KR80]|uniref:type VII secretion integral membrane protein EccD n=1 Tax=Streptomyces sp. KR80 TaxID=3457426 RepID=UPI003FD4775A